MNLVDLITDPLAYGFMQRGLLAALMVGIVCAVMGTFVVLKGLAFIGDAVSHAAFPGLVIAFMLGIPLYVGGSVAAVGTALAIGWVARHSGLRFDTAVGVLFAGTFAFGVMLLSTIKGYTGDLLGYLLGNVLGITPSRSRPARAAGHARASGVVAVLRKELLYATFDPLGAAASGLRVGALEYLLLALLGVTIVVGIQAVGIILVVAMLVTPAATAQLLVTRFDRLMLAGRRARYRVRGRRAVHQLLLEPRRGSDHRVVRDAPVRAGAAARSAHRPASVYGANEPRWPPARRSGT